MTDAVISPPRFGAAIPVHNDFRFLPAVAGQLLKVCDRVIVLRSTKTFAGAEAELVPVPPLEPRIEVITQQWENEGDTRNAGIEILTTGENPCDYVFTVDADEIFTEDTLRYLAATAARGHRAVACFLHTYWKTPRYEIQPPEKICATVIVHKDVRFRYMRVLDGEPHVVNEQLMHHLSYVRTDEEVQEKLRTYAHANQICFKWFERVWLKWDENKDMKCLNPIHPCSFGRAAYRVNDDLEAILESYGVV